MVFNIGDVVEVCSLEKGFKGSYYEAEVISKLPNCEYKVKYKNLVKDDDESEPLIAKISGDELRPLPPSCSNSSISFKVDEIVDAFDKDGWWIGMIVERKGDTYRVEHPMCGEQREYGIGKLRKHRGWVGDQWYPN